MRLGGISRLPGSIPLVLVRASPALRGRPLELAQTNQTRRSNPAAVQRYAFVRQAFPIVDFRTGDSSRSVDARPMTGAGAGASSDHGLKIYQPADATVPPGRQKSSRGLACECEETSGKRPEPLGKARRFSDATQPAYRRSGGRDCERGARTGFAGEVACSRFRAAQQPEHNGA
jgi:hypothetical protein